MKQIKTKIKIAIIAIIGISFGVNAQTLSEKQMQNARATGYSIIASKNPSVDFSVYVIPWDGENTLEYNANNQINKGWHAQAVVKGNYFSQNFDGNDFSRYSSVITSQEKFDQYKDKGTQWWIICSTLPAFSENYSKIIDLTSIQMQNARATGYSIIASKNPGLDFSVYVIPWDGENTLEYNANNQINKGWHAQAVVKGNYFSQNFDGNDFSRYSSVITSQEKFDQYKDKGTQWWIVCSTLPAYSQKTNFKGKVGIGTTDTKGFELGVNGKIAATEVKVATYSDWADFVFEEEYNLPTLKEVENHIKEKGHLKDIPSAEEVETEGFYLGEMDAKLLRKIEELTLYTIDQQKEIEELKKQNYRIKDLEILVQKLLKDKN